MKKKGQGARGKGQETQELLKTGANELGISLTDKEIALFLKYLEELKEWNKKINLTAIKDDKDIVIRHFLDSLTPLSFIKTNDTLLDIGAGAGFPGIPLKIAIPELKVILLDSDGRKVSFMRHIIRTLGLKDISAIQGRAEDRAVIDKLGEFDVITSRAFAELKGFLSTAEPYVRHGGFILAMKGPKGIKELEELEGVKNLSFIEKKEGDLPFSDAATSIFVFKKPRC